MSNTSDREAIEATVKKYIDAIANTQPERLIEAFHPDATMTSHHRGNFRTVHGAGTHIANFMKTVPATAEHSPNYKGRIVSVEQAGTMAFVSVAEDQLQGHDMKTFMLLHKIDGEWLIAAKGTWAPD